MATKVAGELYESITGQLFEIGRQLRQPNGYPFDPERLKTHLQAAIEGRFQVAFLHWPIWKVVKLGTGLKTANEFRKALRAEGNKINDWGKDILGKSAFKAASEPTKIELVLVTVAKLGFNKGAYRKDIYKRALKLGLALCPNEVGPQLRLQYMDQPKGEWLRIAMEPLADSDGDLHVFDVGRGEYGFWLGADGGRPDGFWVAGSVWVFAGRK